MLKFKRKIKQFKMLTNHMNHCIANSKNANYNIFIITNNKLHNNIILMNQQSNN